MKYRPVVLIILDGWGLGNEKMGNAIFLARKPFYNSLLKKYPYNVLVASGEAVGLPAGQMGNSEVGHLNIGAGRIVYQDLTRINRAICSGELQQNDVLLQALERVKISGKALHFIGLLSDGGVHSHLLHLFAFLELAKDKGVERIYLHPILDGRDVPPVSAAKYVRELERKLRELGCGKIATLAGRYYTMDRDQRWARTEKSYLAMVEGRGPKASSALKALEEAYRQGITDEFIEPTVLVDAIGQPLGKIRPGDTVLMYNFRADRARQISYAFTEKEFKGFPRPAGFPQVNYLCLTIYDLNINCPVIFPPVDLKNTLGEVISQAGLKQLRLAETEKYAHVTFFFNGGIERPFPGETRILIPSPQVATYDLQPEMSAELITETLLEKLREMVYDFIVLNYANPDMVGHTGNLKACIQAIEKIDQCLQRVVKEILSLGGVALITADHGNAEKMLDQCTQKPLTAHTINPVPCLLISPYSQDLKLRTGSLRDLAPTILDLMGLSKPPEMTGRSLIRREGK